MYINQNVYDTTINQNYQTIRNYILLNLGYPVIRVELTNEHLTAAIIEAITIYHKYAAIDYNLLIVHPTTNPFPIPVDPITNKQLVNKEYIVDIIFPPSFFDTLGAGLVAGGYIGEFEGAVLPIFGLQQTNGILNIIKHFDISKYYTYLQRLEDIKSIIGLNKLWEIVGNKIQLYPSQLIIDTVGILYKGKLTDEEIEEQDWIKRYALARCKMILGTIRSKLSGINAAGINIAADGEALKSEATTELKELLDEIKTMSMPLPFIQV